MSRLSLTTAQAEQVNEAVAAATKNALSAIIDIEEPKEKGKRGRPKGTKQPAAGAAAKATTYSAKKTAPANNNRNGAANAKSTNASDMNYAAIVSGNRDLPKKATNAELLKLIKELRDEVARLRDQIDAKKTSHPAPTATQNLRTVNLEASDAKERERRSKNVVIRGIESIDGDTAEHDEVNVESFLDAVCPGAKAVKVHRLRQSKQNEPTDQSKRAPVPSILVVLESAEEQQKVLKACRHHTNADFAGIFAHEDCTQAQQLQYSERAKEARSKNEK